MMKYLVIGNGIAGIMAAEAIRQLDQKGEVIVVGDEKFPPYSRPMISMVLEGSQPHGKLPIRTGDFLEKLQVTAVIGQRVDRLDVDEKEIFLRDGKKIGFDRLLIATGADPRPITAEGLTLKNIFYMRTEGHVRRQVEALEGARRALVLGGGLVGFKAAYGLLRRGLKVTMLITSGYPLSMQVDETAGRMILDQLLRQGLDVQVGVSVTAFKGNGRVAAAVTDAGLEIPCDLVVIGKGVLPALDFVPRDRIEVDLGIVVNSRLQSSVPYIYAAGDVAESVDIARQQPWVNAIWPEAANQGRIAGMNMAGRPVTYPGSLSRNVMRVFDLDVMTLGNATPGPGNGYRIVRSGGASVGQYRSLVFKEDILVGAVLVGDIEQGGVLRAMIENRVPVSLAPSGLISSGFNYGKLL
jgi:NAD(P)H-nitrite reductase large subunit